MVPPLAERILSNAGAAGKCVRMPGKPDAWQVPILVRNSVVAAVLLKLVDTVAQYIASLRNMWFVAPFEPATTPAR
jgi:hypothetical protein